MESVPVSGDFANFRAVYDDLTGEVLRSHMQFLPDHLRNWFEVLDTTREVAPIVQSLQSGLDFKKWRDEQISNANRGGVLSWPADRAERLGMKLLMFRSSVEEARADFIAWFGHTFLPSSDRNVNNSARRVIDQVFRPMASELRRYLEKEAASVPAADRSVPLNHNSKEFTETVEAAKEVEKAIQEANDFPELEEKEQRIAEVSAVRRLLQAARVRVEAIVVLMKPLAELAVTKLKDNLVGMAVTTFLGLLATLIHYVGSWF
jgi:nucleotide-binding universal stress UspA family protein